MKFLRLATTVLGMVLMSATFSQSAKADDSNRKTAVIFNGPVGIPGAQMAKAIELAKATDTLLGLGGALTIRHACKEPYREHERAHAVAKG